MLLPPPTPPPVGRSEVPGLSGGRLHADQQCSGWPHSPMECRPTRQKIKGVKRRVWNARWRPCWRRSPCRPAARNGQGSAGRRAIVNVPTSAQFPAEQQPPGFASEGVALVDSGSDLRHQQSNNSFNSRCHTKSWPWTSQHRRRFVHRGGDGWTIAKPRKSERN